MYDLDVELVGTYNKIKDLEKLSATLECQVLEGERDGVLLKKKIQYYKDDQDIMNNTMDSLRVEKGAIQAMCEVLENKCQLMSDNLQSEKEKILF